MMAEAMRCALVEPLSHAGVACFQCLCELSTNGTMSRLLTLEHRDLTGTTFESFLRDSDFLSRRFFTLYTTIYVSL